jgi:hypothetical protein
MMNDFGSGREVAEKALVVLHRAERRSSLSPAEAGQLRRALHLLQGQRPEPAEEPGVITPASEEGYRLMYEILSGAGFGLGGGTVLGFVAGLLTGSLVYPGLGATAGALLGSGWAAHREWRARAHG